MRRKVDQASERSAVAAECVCLQLYVYRAPRSRAQGVTPPSPRRQPPAARVGSTTPLLTPQLEGVSEDTPARRASVGTPPPATSPATPCDASTTHCGACLARAWAAVAAPPPPHLPLRLHHCT